MLKHALLLMFFSLIFLSFVIQEAYAQSSPYLKFTKSVYHVNESPTMILYDPNFSGDPNAFDSIVVIVENDAKNDSLQVTLSESALNSNEFIGSFPVWTHPLSDNIWVDHGSEIVVEYQELHAVAYVILTNDYVEMDQKVYSWRDQVEFLAFSSSNNKDPNTAESVGPWQYPMISTREGPINGFAMIETGPNTGVFKGSARLTGFCHQPIVGPSCNFPDNVNPSRGLLSETIPTLIADDDDGVSVYFLSLDHDGILITGSALVRWSIGEIEWEADRFATNDDAIVRVIDPDMNLSPDLIDEFEIWVYSDSDSFGNNDFLVKETGPSTGIFEGTVFFTDRDESSGNRLRVSLNDNVYAEYTDVTLPDPYTTADDLDIDAKALLDSAVPPWERIFVDSYRVVDSNGNHIVFADTSQPVYLETVLTNRHTIPISVTVLSQIQDQDGVTHDILVQTTPVLNPGQSHVLSQIWDPPENGFYTLTGFVWEDLFTPISYSIPQSTIVIYGKQDYSIKHVEVTQAIQDLNNDIPMVSRKNTFVRVYVDSDPNEAVEEITATLEVCRFKNQYKKIPVTLDEELAFRGSLPGYDTYVDRCETYTPFNGPIIPPPGDKPLDLSRRFANDTINFLIPASDLTYDGPHVGFKIVINPEDSSGRRLAYELDEQSNEWTKVFDFLAVRQTRIDFHAYEGETTDDCSDPEMSLFTQHYNSFARKVLPTNHFLNIEEDVHPWVCTTCFGAIDSGWEAVRLMASLTTHADILNVPFKDEPWNIDYALVGCIKPEENPLGFSGMGQEFQAWSFPENMTEEWSDETMAHEIAHALHQKHVPIEPKSSWETIVPSEADYVTVLLDNLYSEASCDESCQSKIERLESIREISCKNQDPCVVPKGNNISASLHALQQLTPEECHHQRILCQNLIESYERILEEECNNNHPCVLGAEYLYKNHIVDNSGTSAVITCKNPTEGTNYFGWNNPDRAYPNYDTKFGMRPSIGEVGFWSDGVESRVYHPEVYTDFMSYCDAFGWYFGQPITNDGNWVSPYTYIKLLREAYGKQLNTYEKEDLLMPALITQGMCNHHEIDGGPDFEDDLIKACQKRGLRP